MVKPKLLLLDEPSLGLSPNLVSTAFERILHINNDTGVTILIVEQKVRKVLKLCQRVYGIKLGKIAFDGEPKGLLSHGKLRKVFL